MKTPRILAGVVFLAAALAVLNAVPADWLDHVGMGSQDHDVQLLAERAAELDQQTEATHERRLAKAEVIHSLLRGECGLFEAAARFRLIDADSPHADDCQARFPGDSPEEKLCRQVIQRLRYATVPLTACGEVEKQADRLEAQLGRHLRQWGRIELPEPGARPATGPALAKLGDSGC